MCHLRYLCFLYMLWDGFVISDWHFRGRWRNFLIFLLLNIVSSLPVSHLIFWYFPIYQISFSDRIPSYSLFWLLYITLLLCLSSLRNLTFYFFKCLIYDSHQITHSKSFLFICFCWLMLFSFSRIPLLSIILVLISYFINFLYYF